MCWPRIACPIRCQRRNMHLVCHLLQLVAICLLIDRTVAIQIYEVGVPAAVKAGENVLLSCHYDMQGDVLYSIKWYKGRREFYRYTLKENPAKKVFKMVGMNVDQTRSNASHVLLTSVVAANSGKYGCEASADAPSFHTQIMFKEMLVVDLPSQRPSIVGVKERYSDGEFLRANCTSSSRPAANLTWTINDRLVPPSQIYHVKPVRDEESNLQTTTVGIHFLVSSHQHLIQGKLKLKCTASIFELYSQSTERVVDMDGLLPPLSSTGHESHENSFYSSNNNHNPINNNSVYHSPNNMFQSMDPYDYGLGRQENKKEAYMTPIQADMSSSSVTLPAALSQCPLLLMITFQLLVRVNWSAVALDVVVFASDLLL